MKKNFTIFFILYILFYTCFITGHYIYINSKPWYEKYNIVAHALGGIDGYTYTNSYEAFVESYNNGTRVFDADVERTSDGLLVLRHSWQDNLNTEYKNKIRPSFSEFKNTNIYNKYTPLSLEDFLYIMNEYKDIYVAFDCKEKNYVNMWSKIVEFAKENNIENILKRVIVSFYTYDDYYKIKEVYDFEHYVIRYYDTDKSLDGILDFCLKNNVKVVNVSKYISEIPSNNFSKLVDNNIKIYIAVENDITNYNTYEKIGIISDFISEKDIKKYKK